jgi:type VII secretion integral membrane protein EccD
MAGGDVMPDSLCRLSIAHGPHSVDLALPRDTPVGHLLPSIVDLVHRGALPADAARQWQLSRVGDERLDAATSLRDNAIRDGELLLLTPNAIPAPVWTQGDPWHAVIDTVDTTRAPIRITATAACLCAAALGATALVWPGAVTHAASHVITAGVLAAATAVGAVAMRRAHPDPILCITLSVVAVLFAAAAGYLAVPAGPSTANALLAAAVACSTSVLLLRVTRCGEICLTATATFAALTSAASACGVAWTLPVPTTGGALSVMSLGTLGVAARLSIALAGLAPALPSLDDDPAPDPVCAATAHSLLTGLVIGSAGAAVLGAVLVASSCLHDGRWPLASVFAAVVGVVMMLRARTHIDMRRRFALVIAGLVAIAASIALVAVSTPGQANWVCVLAIAIGLSALGSTVGTTVSPLARRAVDVLEYLALTAVVPLACWVGGLYGLIRGLSLP